MSNITVTVSRMFGSGGSEIAQKVADALRIPYYDKEIVKLIAEESGIREDYIESADEKPVNSFLYSIVTHGASAYSSPLPYGHSSIEDRIHSAQAKIIKSIAEKGSSVIIGRGADNILKDFEGLVRVFIYAPREFRIERVSKLNGIGEKEAADLLKKADKARSSYYEFITNKRWGAPENYDICINSKIGTDRCAELILEYIKKASD